MRAGMKQENADGAQGRAVSVGAMSRVSKTLAALIVLAALAGCAREGASRMRSPSMTDPIPMTSTWVESPRYHAADP